MSNLKIYKANSLVEAGYKLTLTEQRVILLSLACINTQDISNKTVTVYAKDLAKRMGIDQKTAIRDLKIAVAKLFDRYITLKNENETRKFRWIQEYAEYHKGEASVSFTYSDRILPLIFELKLKDGGFTAYDLLNVSGFSNSYSFRIYELAIKMKNMQNPILSLEEIRRILQLENKYKEFKDFNKRVLKPSVVDINTKSDILLEIEPIKCGRKIVALKFNIAVKKSLIKINNKDQKRPKFPTITHYKYAKLDKQNPKMSSSDYATYSRDCLKILDDFYNDVELITTEDLRYYYIFLAVNLSHKSRLFNDSANGKNAVYKEIERRGYKLVNCELVEL